MEKKLFLKLELKITVNNEINAYKQKIKSVEKKLTNKINSTENLSSRSLGFLVYFGTFFVEVSILIY